MMICIRLLTTLYRHQGSSASTRPESWPRLLTMIRRVIIRRAISPCRPYHRQCASPKLSPKISPNFAFSLRYAAVDNAMLRREAHQQGVAAGTTREPCRLTMPPYIGRIRSADIIARLFSSHASLRSSRCPMPHTSHAIGLYYYRCYFRHTSGRRPASIRHDGAINFRVLILEHAPMPATMQARPVTPMAATIFTTTIRIFLSAALKSCIGEQPKTASSQKCAGHGPHIDGRRRD